MLEGRKIHTSKQIFTKIVNKTMMSRNMMNKIMIEMMKTTAIVTLKTVNTIARNIIIPTTVHQTMNHHTIPMVMLVTKNIDLGNGRRNNGILDTIVSLSTV